MSDDPYARPPAVDLSVGGHAVNEAVRIAPAAPPPPVAGSVVLSGVRVRYGRRIALHDVDLLAEPGTVVAVTGPAGAGKSTLPWAVAKAIRSDAGEVRVGEPITDRVTGVRAQVALIPEGNGMAGVLTAEENVVFPLLALGVTPA